MPPARFLLRPAAAISGFRVSLVIIALLLTGHLATAGETSPRPATIVLSSRTRPQPPQILPPSIAAARSDPRIQELDRLTAEVVASPEAFLADSPKVARIHELRAQLYPPQPPPRLEFIREVEVFTQTSAEEEEFLVLRAEAWNALAVLHNRHLGAPESARAEAISVGLNNRATQATLERLQILAQALAEKNPPPILPASIDIPPTATPALRAFLTEQNALLEDLRQNPSLSPTDPARLARERSLQEKAQALAQENNPSPTTQPTSR